MTGALAEYRGTRLRIVFGGDDWVAVRAAPGADVLDRFASGESSIGLGRFEHWAKLLTSALDGIIYVVATETLAGHTVSLRRRLPDGRIAVEFVGPPAVAEELGLDGDQYMGWTGCSIPTHSMTFTWRRPAVPEPFVLQKLLTASVAAAIVETGSDQVGGLVSAAAEVAGLRTPAELLAAYGVEAAPEFADVVRFEQPRLTVLAPPDSAERPWQTFPSGFLVGDSMARVWTMSRTRYSPGAGYWRIRSDGEQKRLSHYEGVARGWAGARQWRPPSPSSGRWRGGEVAR